MPGKTLERRLIIGGEWLETGTWLDVSSPYSGETVGRVASGGAREAAAALDAAAVAFAAPLPAYRRAEILSAIAALLTERRDEAARLICAEAGKPMKAARAEAERAASTYTFAAVEARKLTGETVPMDASAAGSGKLAFTLWRPIGIVAAISPFNFPLNLVAHKIAPALAAGCPVVLKPASATPLSALFLAELSEAAGLPPGWLNVIPGRAKEIGDVLIEDERVALITFTGSGSVGWDLAARAPQKRVRLELGNATPVIIDQGVEIPEVATKLAANSFSFAGQSCISVQRIYVVGDAYGDFADRLVAATEALKVGDPAQEDTDVGPLISESERDRVLEWINDSGGHVLTGGTLTDDGLLRPTVIGRPAADSNVECEEVFGPVVTVSQVASLDEAIERANATRYGLQAGIFTPSVKAALHAAERLDFGGVIVNEAPTYRADQMPYGGVKASGNTKEGPAWAVREMTEERLVVLQV